MCSLFLCLSLFAGFCKGLLFAGAYRRIWDEMCKTLHCAPESGFLDGMSGVGLCVCTAARVLGIALKGNDLEFYLFIDAVFTVNCHKASLADMRLTNKGAVVKNYPVQKRQTKFFVQNS